MALVTGGTDGIGKEVALELAKITARLIIVGRDFEKGAQARREISASSPGCDVQFIPADLSLISEARRLGDEVAERVGALHFLVHSAGMVRGRRVLTDEALESNFATNYLSRFALTRRLLPILEAGGQPDRSTRILLVAHPGFSGTIHYEDVNLTSNYSTIGAFRQFHFANDVFAVELARRLKPSTGSPSVTISCLHPGPTKTSIDREMPLWMKLLARLVVHPLISRKPAAAAEAALKLLLSEEFEGQSGMLFSHVGKFRRIDVPEAAQDINEGARLWALSEAKVRSALEQRPAVQAA
ncbi:MAG TPA: SDR family NAD(P)-dependent oxidoreductase [Sphingomicrobium sp.]|nr:SDR family NAD(P)-dependent oxidoreductase [Sphingomicrobium sp.]